MNSRIISPGDIKMRLANCVQNKQGSSFVFLVKIKEEMDIFFKKGNNPGRAGRRKKYGERGSLDSVKIKFST